MRIIMLRPFIPRIVCSLPLGWHNALVDWMPIPALREMREIVGTLDSISKTIYAEKKAAMDGRATKGALAGTDLGPLISILRASLLHHSPSMLNSPTSEGKFVLLGCRPTHRGQAPLTDEVSTAAPCQQCQTDRRLGSIFGAFKTTTVAIARTFYVLTMHPDLVKAGEVEKKEAPQTGKEYNIWYNKWAGGDREDSYSKSSRRCVATSCANMTGVKYCCPFFVWGCCLYGWECEYLHMLMDPLTTLPDTSKDCFAHDKFAGYRDDMGSVGSFQRQNRMLYIGQIKETGMGVETEEVVRRHFKEWGEIEKSASIYIGPFLQYTNNHVR
ncbi:uncharacterized protein LAESUDRAFT_764023 [Laetiporus sulphureus 93-53]|uniref:Torus domain-containing protein n=1 Tax=Laetiporus sulphureus 93-53 TaxID=1314785 RepID=A0A165BI04_9APHY|nr:uncharacterized protein LAESUDRAFT_764023 [Laetiporus sulphureus 93-53]KZT01097.1 hypothetical protein LAESUDRAFT_764023 [Laetiporus sulphureus 93-53]